MSAGQIEGAALLGTLIVGLVIGIVLGSILLGFAVVLVVAVAALAVLGLPEEI